MAEFVIKAADERGHMVQQVERGYSESDVRDRFVQQGLPGLLGETPRFFVRGTDASFSRGRKIRQSQFVIFNQQFLTSDQSRPADPQFAGSC